MSPKPTKETAQTPKQSRFRVEPYLKPERRKWDQMRSTQKWLKGLERAAGFEPATTCLGSKDSTTELRPLTSL